MASSEELVQDTLARFELEIITLNPEAYLEAVEELASQVQAIVDALREEMS